ncbi:SDR family NAD(P)-dependent oxidoreductase [Paenibacillus mendelii]|uniref:SDR family NAD(P)-dependent oxidoreductase n=1 Tax=Paenibacillus mendelii TaxID=206163 RepID=A0ABV6J286_9BACL|nr:SDR family NAD(P)-dependent oxidoreductase [Paenibacillus mendelii]MCQ6560527.1 SDR family NAD(P)-dependent oxidoreductase [Paenibacillus mendelii]
MTPQEAVAASLDIDEGPVVLVEGSDNVGGGAPADSTYILGGEALAIEADVFRTAEAIAMVGTVLDEWGGIDVLVNNAGVCSPASFLEITEEEWDRHVAVNLKGTFITAQRVAQEMTKRGSGGSIINVSSVNGLAAAK